MSLSDIFKSLEAGRAAQCATPVEWVIMGLGNPGTQYENTRHNTGWMAADLLAEKCGVRLDRLKFKSLTGDGRFAGTRALIMKPTTFMNLSGDAAAAAMSFFKLPPERLIVLCDDISLDVGKLRIRAKGSDGGHNGLKDIILKLNSDAFPRIRIGIGAKPHPDFDLADWVLSPFKKDEGEALEKGLDNAVAAAELIIKGDIQRAQNLYN